MTKRVVVTGMGAISAIGNNIGEFWSSLRAGKSGIGPITRFDPERTPAKVAAEVKDFDPNNYWDRRVSQRMSTFSQYAVIAATEAWKNAGLADNDTIDTTRAMTIIGNGIGGAETITESHVKLFDKGPKRIPPMTIPKLIINEAGGNISMELGLHGAAHTVVTACASGTDAMGHALDAIRAGRADIVVTGGTEAAITEWTIGGFCTIKALSTNFNDTPEVASRPFDKDRDGFVMGEGAGILVLEELGHALARGATIYGELAGYGGTADAYHLTAPDPEGAGAARAIKLALEDAGLSPEDIDYINAHGTSTPVNDPVETKAIKAAMGEHAYKLKVSSTKSMTGHCLGAAGAFEAIASFMAMKEGFCPPTINLNEPDEECDLDYVPHVGVESPIRASLSTSLGFGGHNGVLAMKRWDG